MPGKLVVFWQKNNLLRKMILGNRAIMSFVVPKLFFLMVATGLQLVGTSEWLGLALVGLVLFEAALALEEARGLVKQGARQKRVRRSAGSHFGLALIWALVVGGVFGFLALWLAVPLGLLWLGVGLGLLVALNFRLLVLDMQTAPPVATARLFEQVREMHNLDQSVGQLEALVLTTRDKNTRRDAQFYLGWAETFRGHEALARGEWSADEFYQKALRADPCNLAARAMLAIVHARRGDFELALNETHQAIKLFKGEAERDAVIWDFHQNETSSQYEQNAGLFQLCALIIGMLRVSQESGATKQLLEKELIELTEKIPNRSAAELQALLRKKAGGHLGALATLTAGPYRPPASPLDLLHPALILPRSVETNKSEELAA